MHAAFYSKQGPASEVLRIGDQPTPEAGAGEVGVKLRTSGVNPSDWKVRRGRLGRGLSAPEAHDMVERGDVIGNAVLDIA